MSSPASWPSESLIVLKSSTSQNRTARQPSSRRAVVHGVGQAVLEQRAVGQPGERVVQGLVAQALLERLRLADVAQVDDEARDDRVLEQVGDARLDVDEALVRRRAGGGAGRRGRPGWPTIRSSTGGGLARVLDEVEQVDAEQLPGGHVDEALDRLARPQQASGRVGHRDGVGGVAQQAAQPLLALALGALEAAGARDVPARALEAPDDDEDQQPRRPTAIRIEPIRAWVVAARAVARCVAHRLGGRLLDAVEGRIDVALVDLVRHPRDGRAPAGRTHAGCRDE